MTLHSYYKILRIQNIQQANERPSYCKSVSTWVLTPNTLHGYILSLDGSFHLTKTASD